MISDFFSNKNALCKEKIMLLNHSSMQSVVDLLQALIKIPSVNPEGDPDVSPNGEKNVAQFIADFLEPLGFKITIEEVEPGRPNIIARAPGPDNRPRILLGPHLDTVGIQGMTVAPFDAEIRDSKMFGRGTSDTKGPMAAMLWALSENHRLLSDLPIAIDFVGFMGEETCQLGSQHFAKHHGADYEFAIVGEPTSLEAVYCTKGCLWAQVTATGVSTHASQPHLGDNAILKIMTALQSLHHDFIPILNSYQHPVLGSPSLNLGTLNGGTRPNIVPSKATAQIDIRTIPEMVKETTASDLLKAHLPAELSLTHAAESPPMEMTPDHPWLARLQKAHPDLVLTGAPWFSDAAHLSAGGLPSICLGPGSIDQAHTADEFISLTDLQNGADWFSKFITSLQS